MVYGMVLSTLIEGMDGYYIWILIPVGHFDGRWAWSYSRRQLAR